MHVLNIAIGNTTWRLMFKEVGTASIAAARFQQVPQDGAAIEIADDFGQIFAAQLAKVHGILLEDLDQNKLAYAELLLQNERARVMAVKLAQSDPSLRAAVGSGPAIINPMGGNGARPF